MTDFTSATAKIARADDQIKALVSDLDAYCTFIKGQIDHEIDKDANTQVWVYRGTTPDAPIEWSVRIGEILYNLRSVLDHMIWQLVRANGQKPGRDNQFPVVNEQNNWLNSSQRKLKGVGASARKAVRQLQPYTGGINLPFDVSAFWTLHGLCNIDKHRHLNLCVAHTNGIRPAVSGKKLPRVRATGRSRPSRGTGGMGRVEAGKPVLGFNHARRVLEPSFQIEVHFDYPEDIKLVAGTVPAILDDCFQAVGGARCLLRSYLQQ